MSTFRSVAKLAFDKAQSSLEDMDSYCTKQANEIDLLRAMLATTIDTIQDCVSELSNHRRYSQGETNHGVCNTIKEAEAVIAKAKEV